MGRIVETHRTSWIMSLALICLNFGILAPSVALAQDCEVPLFIKQNLTGANLMMLVDNSSSMNAATYHADYDRDVVYSGDFTSEFTYYVGNDGFRTPDDFYSAWPSSPSVFLIDSEMGQDGQYSGNYLNWIYYHATVDQRDNIPRVTRIEVLKTILADLIYRSERLQMGLTVFFPNGDGGNILAYCEGNNGTALASVINGMVANAYTQLGEAMESILDYFVNGGDNDFPSITSPCQFNFCIVVTDGMPTMDTDVSLYLHDADGDGMDPGNCTSVGAPYPDWFGCSDHFDDVAYYMAHEDLRADMEGEQTVATYVIGFHEDGRLLRDAAENGLGLYFHAGNSTELAMCLELAVQDVLRRISAGAAVAVVSTERGEDDRLYRGKFMPVDWDGFLECYNLPYTEGDAAVWEAGGIMQTRTTDSRTIFTALGAVEYDFESTSATVLRAAMDVATDAEAADLISWSRGNDVVGCREREGWILGDIIHSTPVVVGPPANFAAEESYRNFQTANENRRKMVYVGANDGMLHAFDALAGDEVWAFVPEFALPKIQVMADSFYCHTFSCDQTPTVKDLKPGGVWKTILTSGGRQGGSSIFTMDITDPESPIVLWQRDLPNGMSYTADLRLGTLGTSATVLVGSGLDEVTAESWLYAYAVDDGTRTGALKLSTLSSSGFVSARNKTTRPEVVDINMDGSADLAYVGDLGGNIWRIAFNDSPDSDNWTYTKLYEGSEEITANPVAAYGHNGDIYVYFGTGAYLTEDDMDTVVANKFVCVFDHHTGSTVDWHSLVDQTYTINSIDSANGWFVTLWNGLGERVTEQAAVVAETVLFTSFAPTQDPCVAGGESWLYQLAYETGGFAPSADDSADESTRSISLGEGIASYPVVDLAQGTAVIQSSDAGITVVPVSSDYQRMSIKAWMETTKKPETVTEPDGEIDIQ